ncbi:MAG TPA: AAA family ATPase [Candidatus Paceibacterota bacterium]|nr:AAA family ATPase [Candidatus Paceibacterota bacterium]
MLRRLEIVGFKSFAKKTILDFGAATTAIVGPNGSGKSNVAEAFRFALGEQSMKSMRGKRSEDLIFAGSIGAARANRAGVTIVFDNTRRTFKLDFDEIAIERVVYRDGASEYLVNGSKVRLRDIEELLAGANIGETGHHIISQGEADRILLASPKERRAMLEDALGLKLYEFKKEEAQKKLAKTEENIAQVNGLRREIAPHLKFLAGQVEKLERAENMRRELVGKAREYFAAEESYIAAERRAQEERGAAAKTQLAQAAEALARIEERATVGSEGRERLGEIRAHEEAIERLSGERALLAREIGRVEGALAAAKRRSAESAREPYARVPREDLAALGEEIERQAGLSGETLESLRATVEALAGAVKAFVARFSGAEGDLLASEERAVFALENERGELLVKEEGLAAREEKARAALARAREALAAHDETGKELSRAILELAERKAREEGEVARAAARLAALSAEAEALDERKASVAAAAGREALSYPSAAPAQDAESRRLQEERKKALERLTIRLEEAGGAGEDIKAEYKEVSEREAFLARELDDLAQSAASLTGLIKELEAELAKHFEEGLKEVNRSFGEFFALMFGGGGARLALEVESESDEDEDPEERGDEGKEDLKPGIEVHVHLPKKKVQSLLQLSGGERSLTSIALIFAMSQVNPPPFLILDETDAALDEANSRRYGDMLDALSKKSQLIVITHNRETMSRASILYGVTMGADGVSKLLSVKFDEAVAVAK